jgi:glutathione S-transferase
MTENLKLIIGNKNYSSWSLRPWLVLKHLDIAFEEIRVPSDTKTFAKDIAPLSPTGLVPVLHSGELVISDSLAIIEYIDDVLAPGKAWPISASDRAVARALCARMHTAAFPNFVTRCR